MQKHSSFQNTFYTHDNLYVLAGLNSSLADFIYLDPPFNTKRTYSASVGTKAAGTSFKDMWTWKDVDEQFLGTLAVRYPVLAKYIATAGGIHGKPMMAYLTYMAQHIVEMHRVLKDTGSLFLHCDPTASHYLKLLLDSVFNKKGFRNEISWCYKRPSATRQRQLPRLHDIVLWYSKGGCDCYENYQLLCGHCNRRKGCKPMEYLRTQIDTREKMLNAQIIFGE